MRLVLTAIALSRELYQRATGISVDFHITDMGMLPIVEQKYPIYFRVNVDKHNVRTHPNIGVRSIGIDAVVGIGDGSMLSCNVKDGLAELHS